VPILSAHFDHLPTYLRDIFLVFLRFFALQENARKRKETQQFRLILLAILPGKRSIRSPAHCFAGINREKLVVVLSTSSQL
jgi:hypothetical protein